MINLLAQRQQKTIIRHYYVRLVSLGLQFFIISMLIGIALLVPTYLSVRQEAVIFAVQTEQIRSSDEFKVTNELNEAIRGTSRSIGLFADLNNDGVYSNVLNDLFALFNNGSVDGVLQRVLYEEYEGGETIQITMVGQVTTRNELTELLSILRENTDFKKVDSPISNFVNNTNVRFEITIQTNKELLYAA